MRALSNRIETITSASLSGAVDVAANLIAQLSELNELRERVRKAQLSARRSRRTNHRKKSRHVEKSRPESIFGSGCWEG
jgi:ATP/maltotriose-dependent transcriptional regulator MalT